MTNTKKNTTKKNTTKKNATKKNATKKNEKREAKIKEMKIKLRRRIFPKLTKQQITKILYPFSLENAIESFNILRNSTCENLTTLDKSGVDFVNYFTSIERLNTSGRLNFSFFDVYYNFNDYYNTKYYFRHAINSLYGDKLLNSNDLAGKIKMLKGFFTLYLGNIGVFKPVIVKDMICKYKPKVMLDFTMGWGGRLTAACSENIHKYIGIDLNTNLKPLYAKMVKTLNTLSKTKIQLFFKSATEVDYSKLDYDFVLTSPPYYNLEIYNKNSIITKEEWDNTFYIPVFTETYKHLKRGGHYCLNVPMQIYEDVCVKILGKCDETIPLGRPKRGSADTYQEYIYVWKK